jgi:hypothetical protein
MESSLHISGSVCICIYKKRNITSLFVNSAGDFVFFLVTGNYKGRFGSSGHQSDKKKSFQTPLLLAVICILNSVYGDK